LKENSILQKNLLPQPEIIINSPKTKIGIINFGSTTKAINEALNHLSNKGIGINHMRIRAFPFSSKIDEFINKHDIVFIVEQNRDGQIKKLLVNEIDVISSKLLSILNYDGMPLTAQFLINKINEYIEEDTNINQLIAPPIKIV